MLKKIIVCFVILCTSPVFASKNCFLAKENAKIIKSEGDCNTRYSPCSTFKIPLALMGYDAGILKNESSPSWPLPVGVDPYINICKGAHDPRTWMRDSCLWYSRILTAKLGMEKFQDYIIKFSYGNMDISGEQGQNNGLTHAWICSSLEISPDEQTVFLQKLVDQKLHVSKLSYAKTKKIMFVQEMPGGWQLYGKTGNGRLTDKNGQKTDLQQGWFVGWIEKGDRKIMFASHIVDDEKQSTFASLRAKNEALLKLWYIIEQLEQ